MSSLAWDLPGRTTVSAALHKSGLYSSLSRRKWLQKKAHGIYKKVLQRHTDNVRKKIQRSNENVFSCNSKGYGKYSTAEITHSQLPIEHPLYNNALERLIHDVVPWICYTQRKLKIKANRKTPDMTLYDICLILKQQSTLCNLCTCICIITFVRLLQYKRKILCNHSNK